MRDDHAQNADSFWGPTGRLVGRLARRIFNRAAKDAKETARDAAAKAGKTVHAGADLLEAATVNADHPMFRKSERANVSKVFAVAGGAVACGATLVWATSGIPAIVGYGLMTAGKATFFRGCRVLKPYNPHAPAPWAKGTRVLAIADFLEAASRNISHPWMKPASATNAKTKLMLASSVAVIGFVMGITTVGIPSMIGTALYAVGGFVGYRAYRTLFPFNPLRTSASAVPSIS